MSVLLDIIRSSIRNKRIVYKEYQNCESIGISDIPSHVIYIVIDNKAIYHSCDFKVDSFDVVSKLDGELIGYLHEDGILDRTISMIRWLIFKCYCARFIGGVLMFMLMFSIIKSAYNLYGEYMLPIDIFSIIMVVMSIVAFAAIKMIKPECSEENALITIIVLSITCCIPTITFYW